MDVCHIQHAQHLQHVQLAATAETGLGLATQQQHSKHGIDIVCPGAAQTICSRVYGINRVQRAVRGRRIRKDEGIAGCRLQLLLLQLLP